MAEAKVAVDVRGVPECVWAARSSMARLLRNVASHEPNQYTAKRLVALAAIYETGKESTGG